MDGYVRGWMDRFCGCVVWGAMYVCMYVCMYVELVGSGLVSLPIWEKGVG